MSEAQVQEGQAPESESDKQIDTVNETAKAESVPAEVTADGKDEALSSKYAALAKREKLLRQRAMQERKEIEAQKASFLAEKKELEAQREELARYRAWKEQMQLDPKGVLDQAGVSYDKLTNQYLNADPQSQEIMDLKRELMTIRQEQEQARLQYQKSQAESYEQAKKQIRTEVSLLVDGDENFEAIQKQGDIAIDAVVELIEKTYNEDGYIMPIDQATREVEDYLVSEAMEFMKLKKIQSKLNPPKEKLKAPEESEAKEKTQTSQKTQTQSPTLSNRHTPSARRYSEKERLQRAILRAQGIDPDSATH